MRARIKTGVSFASKAEREAIRSSQIRGLKNQIESLELENVDLQRRLADALALSAVKPLIPTAELTTICGISVAKATAAGICEEVHVVSKWLASIATGNGGDK